jgi:serine/threonine protein kinase
MTGLLKMDPSERFTGEQALAHPYFDDIREPSDRTPLASQTNENDMDLSGLIAPA